MLHHCGVVLSHPVAREQLTRARVLPGRKYSLNLINRLLLLHVGLSKPPKDALLVPLKALRFAIFSSNLYNLLLNRLVFLLADGGPLLSRDPFGFLLDSLLARPDLPLPLLHLLHIPGILLLFCLEELDALLFDCIRVLLPIQTQRLLTVHRLLAEGEH